jgi:hypothetical protein
VNAGALAGRLSGLGLVDDEVARRFLFINSGADAFQAEGVKWGDVS